MFLGMRMKKMNLNKSDFIAGTLYRAKRNENKSWITGWYLQRYDAFDELQCEIFYAKNAHNWEFAPIITDTLCRFSGYKDANEIQIWEHDIIEEPRRKLKGEVLFGLHGTEIGWYIRWLDQEALTFRQDFGYWKDKIKVIGNCFDGIKKEGEKNGADKHTAGHN